MLLARQAARAAAPGTQFTCFTSKTVQILTQKFQPEVRIFKSGKKDASAAPGTHSVDLLYWYKSTNTDDAQAPGYVGEVLYNANEMQV